MATKFRIIGTSDIYGKVTVNIGLAGYVGAVTEFDGAGRDWIELKIGSGSDIVNPILAGDISINFYVKTNFITIELGQAEDYQYSIEVLDLADELIWSGWVNPEQYSERYTSLPYLVTLKGSDGLDGLKTASFSNLTGKHDLFAYLLKALEGTRLSLPIFESVNLYSNGMDSGSADSPLKQAEIDSTTFAVFGDDVNCAEALEAILRPMFSRIYQYRGWRIENIQAKSGSYIEREFTALGVYVGFATVDPIIEMDTATSIFRGLVNKSGALSFNPALRNAEVYISTVEATGETTTGGFQNEADWVDENELTSWNIISGVVGITIERVIAEFNGNKYAVKIPGKQATLQPNYIESDSYPLTVAEFETIDISFSHRFDFPAIIITGSRPVLFFQVILETTFAGFATTYYWTANGWSFTESYLRIETTQRRRWRDYSISIGTIPSDGTVKFRFYKLVKSGSAESTEIRLTGWKTNLRVAQPNNTKILLEGATTGAVTAYKGPSFQHYISDGLVLGVSGVMEVDGALTATWNRRGKTDNLNIRRLFLLQWLSMNGATSAVLSGDFFQRGEQITPMTVIKDKDSISSRKYIAVSITMGLGSGFSRNVYREIFDADVVPTFFEEELEKPREGDYFIVPIRITVPGLSDGANIPEFTLPEIVFPELNGDVSGETSNARLNPSAILNKDYLDISTLTDEDIVFNAVKDLEEGQAMTKLRLSDVRNLIAPAQAQYGLLSGGVILYSGIGQEYLSSLAVVAIGSVLNAPASSKTLDPADATFDRFDVLGWRYVSAGVAELFYLKGTAAASPTIPQVNPESEVEGKVILVPALSSGPTGVVTEIVYEENTIPPEWTVSSSGTGTVSPASTENPKTGTKSIKVSGIENGFKLILTRATAFDILAYETIGLDCSLIATLGASQGWTVGFLDSSGNPASSVISLPMDKSLTVYQFLGLNLDLFTFTTTSIKGVVFTYVRTKGGIIHSGAFFDNIKIQGGVEQPQPVGVNGWSPVLAVVTDGSRRVFQVIDWTGGSGTKPVTGLYVGASGLTAVIASAVDVRGVAGDHGREVEIQNNGTHIQWRYVGDLSWIDLVALSAITGPAGVGVPVGGATGQVLKKIDGTDYNTEWADESGGGGGADANAVHYNASDGKTYSEKQQARSNIGVIGGTPEVFPKVTTNTDILTRTSNFIEITGASGFNLQAVQAGTDGEILAIKNSVTSGVFNIINNYSVVAPTSDWFAIGSAYVVEFGQIVFFIYDGALSKWVFLDLYLRDYIINRANQKILADAGTPLLTLEGNVGVQGLLKLKHMQTTANKMLLRGEDWNGTILYDFRDGYALIPATLSQASGALTCGARNLERWTNNSSTGAINNLSLTDTTLTTLVFLGASPDLSGVIHVTALGGWRKYRFRFQTGGTIRHQSALSTAANRFNLIGLADMVVPALGWVDIEYTQGSRWEVTNKNF